MKYTTSLDRAALRKALGWSLLVAIGATVATSLAVKAVAQTPPAVATAAPAAVAAPALPGPTTNPNPVPASVSAHSCAACHGTNGQLGDEYFKPLAGMPVAQFVRTMTDFREGRRPSTLMGHVARGFTDADLQGMGAFFAAQPPLATAVASKGAQ
ncbi:MAG: cytochrome c class I [Hydrogenophaga sp.]|uniref:c-type cytochrome n=1 Tax=Hydrogenophaga sp. TaxID=1904254 RepID=UPI0027167AD9|nr:cytochrome c class I [Hydrogenophaga sp.]MDO9483679.1 cytochrome c class I [Hydrogenophaga sp.]MDP3347213.1 cytochrome c class I [Hydrogenophaga sp.]MDP3806996.1 cytochrome c class I [Hydrogenophaga sp.]MDP3925172.1 cytochrome c class I [Hydrogenophaga sp.]